MKKLLLFLVIICMPIVTFAAGENIPTSKSYVDAAVAQKQDKISASIIMPAGYTALEYIESTGTQWIDTQQKFMYGDEFYFEYMPVASYSTENKGYGAGVNLGVNITGGGRNSNSRVCMYDFNANLCYEPQLLYNYTLGRRYIENWTLKSGVFHSVLTDVNDGSTYTISKDSISQSYDSGDSVYLWRDHASQYSYPSKSRIYRTWLKRADGTMAFDLFPARRNSDGVLGMYDMVTGQFFTNSGTGEFIAGPVTPGNQVLTNTGTAGEYGTKGIYDANGDYSAQQNALVDAQTMNAGVQNAINTEFRCVEWVDPNDPTSECLLLDALGYSNLLTNPAKVNNSTFDPETSILSNTRPVSKNYLNLHIYTYTQTAYSQPNRTVITGDFNNVGEVIKRNFTSVADMRYLYIKHNDSIDIGAYFPIEPLTNYTILVKILSMDMSVVGGMKLQLMLVRGEYPYDDIILPENMVYMP